MPATSGHLTMTSLTEGPKAGLVCQVEYPFCCRTRAFQDHYLFHSTSRIIPTAGNDKDV